MEFDTNILKVDSGSEIEKITNFILHQSLEKRRRGIVIGLSGGIDSALCVELCTKSLGQEKILGLILPEKESNPVSEVYALKQAQKMGIKIETIDITPALEGFGTYKKRDEIVKEAFPDYNHKDRIKITMPPDLLSKDAMSFFSLKIENPAGKVHSVRLNRDQLNGIVAATDTKQRTRMMHLYYYAEKLNYLVCGTTNRSETIQGFFVKFGDGGVDIEPISHIYKTQVYELSEYLNVIPEIRNRTPSPDTFSFEVSDEEFYFRMPYEKLDLLLYAWENKIPHRKICQAMDLTIEQVRRVFRDFTAKYNATKHLRELPPSLF